jgi:hypothetical protein
MRDLADLLPPKLAEIAELIGVDAAFKLSAAWPGIRLFVPKQVSLEHPIAVAIGLQAARKLAEMYGGETVVIPMAARAAKARLHARILAEYRPTDGSPGASASALARKYGVHQLSIYRLAAKLDAEHKGDLC